MRDSLSLKSLRLQTTKRKEEEQTTLLKTQWDQFYKSRYSSNYNLANSLENSRISPRIPKGDKYTGSLPKFIDERKLSK